MINNYYKPTPVWIRKIGDALLAVSTTITTYAIASHQNTIAIVSLVSGTLGKFLTNLFKEDDAPPSPQNPQ